MWVEFVICSHPCLEGFLWFLQFSSLQRTNISNSNSTWKQWTRRATSWNVHWWMPFIFPSHSYQHNEMQLTLPTSNPFDSNPPQTNHCCVVVHMKKRYLVVLLTKEEKHLPKKKPQLALIWRLLMQRLANDICLNNNKFSK